METKCTDDIYINKVLAGDTEAFSYFVKNYKDGAFNLAVSIIKDDHYAEEVVQDAFIKAFKSLKSFRRTAKFKSWFYRIVVNESFQHLRKIKKDMILLNLDEVNEPLENAPLDQLGEDEQMDKINRTLKLLSPKESLALNLFYLEGNNLEEICNITEWTLSNTKVILHRARKNVRSMLKSTLKTKN